MPVRSRHLAASSGESLIFTPSASRQSAAPDLLEAARLPCFATGIPAAAITNDEVVDMLKDTQRQVEKAEIINELVSDISACENKMADADEKILELVRLVDGVRTNEAGLVIKNKHVEAVTEGFAKMAVNGEITMATVGVNDSRIYNPVRGSAFGYVDVSQILQVF